MLHRKMSKEDITQCLNFLGLDTSDKTILNSRINKLSKIRKKVLEMEKNGQLPGNSFFLFLLYEELLRKKFKNPKERAEFIENSLTLLNEVSQVNVLSPKSEDYIDNFCKVNEIYITFLIGLDKFQKQSLDNGLTLDDIKNMSAKELYHKYVVPSYLDDADLFGFYGLIALSKIKDTDTDYEMFDENGTISYNKLFWILKYGIITYNSKQTGDIALSDREKDSKINDKLKDNSIELLDKSQKRLILRRPSYKTMCDLAN